MVQTFYTLGMGKEILLMVSVEKAHSAWGNRRFCGLVRMHELPACEIPLLWSASLSFWTPPPTVFGLQTYVDDSAEEARSSGSSQRAHNPSSRLRGRFHASPIGNVAPRYGVAHVSVSLPESTRAFCSPTQPTASAIWNVGAPGRWIVVPVQAQTMGTVSDGAEILSGASGCVPGSRVGCGERNTRTLGGSPGTHSSSGQPAHLRYGSRQPPWNAKGGPTARLGVAAVSLPSAPEALRSTRLATSCTARWASPRRNPAAHPPGTFPTRWRAPKQNAPTPANPVQNRLRHRPHADDSSSVSTRSPVLPVLPRSPSTRPASNHKHSRINGTTAPGNVPTQSIRIKPGFDSTVGNSLHTHTPNCGLQQQMINRFFLPIPILYYSLIG
jgi:hypothetical protein